MKFKYELYEEAGVLEYWIVDPTHNAVLFFYLDEKTGEFVANRPLAGDDVLKSRVLEGFEVNLLDIFPKEDN